MTDVEATAIVAGRSRDEIRAIEDHEEFGKVAAARQLLNIREEWRTDNRKWIAITRDEELASIDYLKEHNELPSDITAILRNMRSECSRRITASFGMFDESGNQDDATIREDLITLRTEIEAAMKKVK